MTTDLTNKNVNLSSRVAEPLQVSERSAVAGEVNVGADVKLEPAATNAVKVSRRNFLKIVGASSAATAAGCAPDKRQEIFPHVKGQDGVIPGEPVWFKSTCTECSAGCGIMVKTVDGRTIKVEGNKEHPVNRGSLCALGQASLQHLYDPDRVRQPLKRTVDKRNNTQFVPVEWDEAFQEIATALQSTERKHAALLGSVISSSSDLFGSFAGKFAANVVYSDVTEPVAIAEASAAVFGHYGIPEYRFENADFILNFGADFLETWVSPCEYARGWSKAKRSEPPVMFVHFEPRLSLTGGNADLWLKGNPGSELAIVRALLTAVIAGQPDLAKKLPFSVPSVSFAEAATISGVAEKDIKRVAELLGRAKSPLVIAGGTAAATLDPHPLMLAVQSLNVVCGAIGKTVIPENVRPVFSSAPRFAELIKDLEAEKVGVFFTHGGNQAFTSPAINGFGRAARKASLTVALSSHLDETAALADYILPTNTGLESWGYNRATNDALSTLQPSMAPVFDTRDVGDILLTITKLAGKEIAPQATTKEYVRAQFSGHLESKAKSLGGGVDQAWVNLIEAGGVLGESARSLPLGRVAPTVDVASVRSRAAQSASSIADSLVASKAGELLLYPYPSIKSFDGRAANRPWLQELPDPVTQLVWDAWGEIHPDTAAGLGVVQGDMLALRTSNGEVKVPAYVTNYVAKGIVAVPMGQGHQEYGRFAKVVGDGNVFSLVGGDAAAQSSSAPLLFAKVGVTRLPSTHKLVSTSGSDSQHDRELAKTKYIAPPGETLPKDDHGGHGAHHHGPVKQTYHQREHPLYRWGLSVDLNACTGCSACVVACYAENNIAVVGKEMVSKGREMSWLRIERYYDNEPGEELKVSYLPMMCQHCGNAPCEPVCPVYATYHNEEGLNAMVYNRCVGTRYCSNNCSYKVRRFNWVDIEFPEPLNWQLNPAVTKRTGGVMEKCTFCVQRINEVKDRAKDEGRFVADGEIQPACVQGCPTEALVFGNLNDPESAVSKMHAKSAAYKVLDPFINTQPAVAYLEKTKYKLT